MRHSYLAFLLGFHRWGSRFSHNMAPRFQSGTLSMNRLMAWLARAHGARALAMNNSTRYLRTLPILSSVGWVTLPSVGQVLTRILWIQVNLQGDLGVTQFLRFWHCVWLACHEHRDGNQRLTHDDTVLSRSAAATSIQQERGWT